MAAIFSLLAPLWRPLAALLAGLVGYWKGRSDARRDARIDAADAYRETMERIADAPVLPRDADAARAWLLDRSKRQRRD